MDSEKIHILMVDDDVGACRLVKQILNESSEPLNFAFETAGTLAEGMERLGGDDFDLALLDLGLPDSSGLQTVETLCRAYPHIPIVVLTGLADEEISVQAIKKGASDYLVKGRFFRDMLARTIRHSFERKQIERQLRKSESTLNAMLHSIADPISPIDKDSTILWANEFAKEMFGHDIVGRKCYEAYHGRNKPCELYPCPTLKVFHDGKAHQHDTKLTCKDGQIRYFHCTANVALRDEAGEPTAVIKVNRDITKRKQAEEALQKIHDEMQMRVAQRTAELAQANKVLEAEIAEREKAERAMEKLNRDLEATVHKLRNANRGLEEFAHIAAHDLKTPLRGIGTSAHWIATDYGDKLDEQGKEYVRLLVTRAKQMTALIDSVLRYSCLAQHGQEKQPVDLNAILAEVITEIAPPDHIEVAAEKDLPTIVGRKTHVIQILQNLLDNAVKYMDKPKGTVRIGCVEQHDFWTFSVADNGPGIDAKYFEKTFEIFQTLAPRDGAESTGIGLSIVKKLVELNNGRVWVESQLGKGSTFFFTLPKEAVGAANPTLHGLP